MPPNERASNPSLDDLDAGWGEDDEEDEIEEVDEIDVPDPDVPGLTPEEREARLEARKERARTKATAKKERRKARQLAAAGKKKPKQKRSGRREVRPTERSAPSLRGVSKDTDAKDASGDPLVGAVGVEPSALTRGSAGSRSPSRSPQPRGGLSRATMIAIAALVIVLAAVGLYVFRK